MRSVVAIRWVFAYVDLQFTVFLIEASGYQFGCCEMFSYRIFVIEKFEADEI